MPNPGATIGAYRIVSKIGEGGMSAVYLANHRLLSRNAAIKVLLPSLSANAAVVERFFQEARSVSLLADPGIVQVFDFGYHADGRAFLVMELLDGEPVDKRLRRMGRIPLIDCLRLMRLCCAALEVAHNRGIVHCDLKPGNLFVVPDCAVAGGERIKILDFGIAKVLRDDEAGKVATQPGVCLGTPAYMSPEQCRDRTDVDHRSDIYSLACVMFAMLTGRPPFRSKMPGELVAAHLREPAPLAASRVPELPIIIDDILQRCLAKSPADRFQSTAELSRALGDVERSLAGDGSAVPVSVADASAIALPAARDQAPIGQIDSTTFHFASGQSITLKRSGDPVHGGGVWRSAAFVIGVAAICGVVAVLQTNVGNHPLTHERPNAHMAVPGPMNLAVEIQAPASGLSALDAQGHESVSISGAVGVAGPPAQLVIPDRSARSQQQRRSIKTPKGANDASSTTNALSDVDPGDGIRGD